MEAVCCPASAEKVFSPVQRCSDDPLEADRRVHYSSCEYVRRELSGPFIENLHREHATALAAACMPCPDLAKMPFVGKMAAIALKCIIYIISIIYKRSTKYRS